MPGLDIKTMIEGKITCCYYVESDQSLSMATKYASRTPYCFMGGFPVLRISSAIRQPLNHMLVLNRPKRALYAEFVHDLDLG